MRPSIPFAGLALALAGCTVGDGEGVVVGSLVIPGCDGDEGLDRESAFDLDVDYFVAQPFLDPDDDEEATKDALSIRLQHGGAATEVADSLSIQVVDVDEVTEGAAVEVGPSRFVRANLTMGLRCPDAFENLQAEATNDAACATEWGAGLFSGDFDNPNAYQDPFWAEGQEHPSCIVFDEIGTDFGDEIAAAFHFNLRDPREKKGEERVRGFVRGRFRFSLERGPGAQAFP